jgi:hypothetical protein
VRDGKLIKINEESYFDLGRDAVKLKSPDRLLDITYDPDQIDFDWLPDLWTAYGPKGLVALGFFVMSLFAVQIRERHKSIGFLEITGDPGAGKSTMVEFLWKTLGRPDTKATIPTRAPWFSSPARS